MKDEFMKGEFDRIRESLLDQVGVVPGNQVNAHLPDTLQMRVGIPHRGGRLAIHAFESGYPAMVSANAFFNPKTGRFVIPRYSPLQDLDFALDSAGFVAMQLFKSKGPQRGIGSFFPWSYSAYLELAALLRPAWYAQPDLCCEPEATNGGSETGWRIRATATMLEATLQILEAWQNEYAKDVSAITVANTFKPCVPVCQGWFLSDFLLSLDLLMEVWSRHTWLAPPALIGLGSVCRRSLHDPKHGLLAILDGLADRLPKNVKLHCFGIKGAALEHIRAYPFVASVDSMGYDYAARKQAWKAGFPNTMAHRAAAMTQWMQRAEERMRVQSGDWIRPAHIGGSESHDPDTFFSAAHML